MTDVILVCAGTYGKEALLMINEHNRLARISGEEEPYRILGFIDDNPHAFDGTGIEVPILGPLSEWQPKGNERYILCTSSPGTKVKIASMLKERGCQFASLIAPWSHVSPYCEMGEGCFITSHSITAGVRLGNFVNVNGSMLCPGTFVDDFSTTTGFTVVENAHIGKRVFVGSHAVITGGVTVGDDAQVSVGSIVTEDVLPGTTVFGVPAVQMA